MSSAVIKTEYEREQLIKRIQAAKLPFSIGMTKGKRRSIEQNRLQRLWLNEIAEQLDDQTPEEVRGYCKLTLGVPILRAENDAFRERYDRIIKPMPYETKLEMMMEPLDFPVTRLMSVNQHTRYLDSIGRHFAEQGLILTDPERLGVPA